MLRLSVYRPRRRKSTKALYPVRSNVVAMRTFHHTGRFSAAAMKTNRVPVVKATSAVETPASFFRVTAGRLERGHAGHFPCRIADGIDDHSPGPTR
jgi:hypothetical protein